MSAFYSGVLQDVAKSVTDSFLFFLAYSFLRDARLRSATTTARALPVVDELAVGMLAGAFGKFFTTPIQNIVTRKQTAAIMAGRSSGRRDSPPKTPETSEIIEQILGEKGPAGFWAGYSASLVLTLNPALTFLLHETLTRAVIPRRRRADPGPAATFLLAAVSKAVASTLTYPFSLAKTRAQVSSQFGSPSSVEKIESREAAAKSDSEKRSAIRRRQTVFSIVLHIARHEGFGALYQGLGGEVLKGFFAHGVTMLMKERIHGAIVRLYFLLIKTLKQQPTPKDVAQTAGSQVSQTATVVTEKAGSMAESATETGKQMLDKSGERLAEGARWGREKASGAKEMMKGEAYETKVAAGDVYGNGKERVLKSAREE